MLRVSDETRERVLRLGREEFGGASADETIRRLIDDTGGPAPSPRYSDTARPIRGAGRTISLRPTSSRVVSSRFHLELTMGRLVSVLPLTSVERRGWMHRVHVASGGGWVITEQVRTASADRFRRYAPEMTLSEDELDEVRHVLAQMLTM